MEVRIDFRSRLLTLSSKNRDFARLTYTVTFISCPASSTTFSHLSRPHPPSIRSHPHPHPHRQQSTINLTYPPIVREFYRDFVRLSLLIYLAMMCNTHTPHPLTAVNPTLSYSTCLIGQTYFCIEGEMDDLLIFIRALHYVDPNRPGPSWECIAAQNGCT